MLILNKLLRHDDAIDTLIVDNKFKYRPGMAKPDHNILTRLGKSNREAAEKAWARMAEREVMR